MIKILIPLEHDEFSYEGVWVKELSTNTGEINNLPVFTKEYKFGDIIEFAPDTCKATRLVQDREYTPTELVRYEGDYQCERGKWEAKGYVVEGFGPGMIGVTRKRIALD